MNPTAWTFNALTALWVGLGGAIGWIFGWAIDPSLTPQHRAFLMVGVLGGTLLGFGLSRS